MNTQIKLLISALMLIGIASSCSTNRPITAFDILSKDIDTTYLNRYRYEGDKLDSTFVYYSITTIFNKYGQKAKERISDRGMDSEIQYKYVNKTTQVVEESTETEARGLVEALRMTSLNKLDPDRIIEIEYTELVDYALGVGTVLYPVSYSYDVKANMETHHYTNKNNKKWNYDTERTQYAKGLPVRRQFWVDDKLDNEVIYKYDDHGDLLYEAYKSKEDPYVLTYHYQEYDNRGNWTERKILKNKIPFYLERRTVHYR